MFVTHDAVNNFPPLPLRDEQVLVWVTSFSDEVTHAEHLDRLADSNRSRSAMRRLAVRCNETPMQQLRLRPTAHSPLH